MNGNDLLVSYATERSEEAFARFVGRYANLVFSIAKRRLGDAALAEDVTQGVFIRLAQSPPEAKDEARIVGWLHRVTTNAAIDAWRKEARRREREKAAVLMETDLAGGPSEELASNLDEALEELREPERQAILLRYFSGHRIAEVGRLLGISEEAAKMRVYRAVEALKGKLEARGVKCAGGVLLAFLMDRTVEAAPAGTVAQISGLKANPAWRVSGKAGVGLPFKAAIAFVLAGAAIWMIIGRHSESKQTALAPMIPETAQITKGVEPDQKRLENTVRLQPIQPLLNISVTDAETGRPIPSAKIRGAYFHAAGAGEVHFTQTDQDGLAEFPYSDKEHRGKMNLFVTAENYVPICYRWDYQKEPALKARLDPARTIAGTVFDEQGQPVSGALVHLRGPSADNPIANPSFGHDEAGVLSSAGGEYIFPFAPRTMTNLNFRVSKEEYAGTETKVLLTNAATQRVDLLLKKGAALAGKIVDFEGKPVGGATVREVSNWGFEPPSTKSDAAGEFLLLGLIDRLAGQNMIPEADIPFRVIVQAEGLRPEIRDFRPLALTNWADFKLEKGITFRGRILDQQGKPIEGASIRTDSDSHGLDIYRWRGKTDADGEFEWPSAPATETLFWFEAPGYAVQRDIPVNPNQTNFVVRLKKN